MRLMFDNKVVGNIFYFEPIASSKFYEIIDEDNPSKKEMKREFLNSIWFILNKSEYIEDYIKNTKYNSGLYKIEMPSGSFTFDGHISYINSDFERYGFYVIEFSINDEVDIKNIDNYMITFGIMKMMESSIYDVIRKRKPF